MRNGCEKSLIPQEGVAFSWLHTDSLLENLLFIMKTRKNHHKMDTRNRAPCFLNFRKNCQNFAKILLNFRQILTKNFRDFSNFSKTKHTANVCWAVPQAGRFSETFAGFCTRPVCPFLASSSARPAAALRDLIREKSATSWSVSGLGSGWPPTGANNDPLGSSCPTSG